MPKKLLKQKNITLPTYGDKKNYYSEDGSISKQQAGLTGGAGQNSYH
ncbi:MAG: hypothetical protein KFW09_01925 [Oscillospiraceae bacterium]|nr:hypothetical protein [Oscillospiraceae bacterium]